MLLTLIISKSIFTGGSIDQNSFWIYLVYAIPTFYLAFSEFEQEIIYWIVQIIYYVYLSQKPSKEKNRFGSPAKKF